MNLPNQLKKQKSFRDFLHAMRSDPTLPFVYLVSFTGVFYLVLHFAEHPQDRLQVLDIFTQSAFSYFLLVLTLNSSRRQNNLQEQLLTIEERRSTREKVEKAESLYATFAQFLFDMFLHGVAGTYPKMEEINGFHEKTDYACDFLLPKEITEVRVTALKHADALLQYGYFLAGSDSEKARFSTAQRQEMQYAVNTARSFFESEGEQGKLKILFAEYLKQT